MTSARVLLCTVGTSLKGNLQGLRKDPVAEHSALAEAFAAGNLIATAQELARLDPASRVCGAEINSINSLLANRYFQNEPRQVGRVVHHAFRLSWRAGHPKQVDVWVVEDGLLCQQVEEPPCCREFIRRFKVNPRKRKNRSIDCGAPICPRL